jgi:hypothetical protein
MRAIISAAFFLMPILIGGVASFELAKVVMPTIGMMVGYNGELIAAAVGGGLGLLKSLTA